MKAIVVTQPNQYALKDILIPTPPPGWALLKTRAAAFCATDLEVLSGGIPAAYPVTPGHEWCADVVGINDPDTHLMGKRVVGSNDICCLTCSACRSGAWRNCASFGEIGFAYNGAYAQYFAAPLYALRELPANISDIQAAMLEPLGVALGTLDKVEARLGDSLLIFGAGSIGLNMLAAAKAAGLIRITVVDLNADRLSMAKSMGAYAALTPEECDIKEELKRIYPEGPDITIDCTGANACIRLALETAPKGGRIGLAGYSEWREMNMRMDEIHIKNLRVSGAGNNWNLVDRCIRLVEAGVIDTECLCTQTNALEDFERVADAAKKRAPGLIKAVFVDFG